ncbi:MAG: hypothetical protein P8M07_02240, partial [Flavobacteriales bacterium]|nr:hypothetical protein [Flavobacteriales bacterium]
MANSSRFTKPLLTLLLAILTGLSAEGQAVFKRLPDQVELSPEWAQKMYAPAPNFHEVVALRQAYWTNRTYVKTLDERNFKHWLIHVEHLVDEQTGRIEDAGEWAAEQFESLGGLQGQRARAEAQTDPDWQAIGPMETYSTGTDQVAVSWQCNAYCFGQSVSNPDVVVAGIEGGDLFKSTDRGLNWLPITANLGIRTATQVAIAPSDENVIYVVSNNTVYRTIDGGVSWNLLHNLGNGATQIAVHPSNPNKVFVASYNGLQSSING